MRGGGFEENGLISFWYWASYGRLEYHPHHFEIKNNKWAKCIDLNLSEITGCFVRIETKIHLVVLNYGGRKLSY